MARTQRPDKSRPIGVLAYGDPNLDIVFRADSIPGWGDKVVGKSIGNFAGGTAANVACAASRLGVSAAAFGRVGNDAHGQFLIAEFERFGVRTEYVCVVPDTPSSMATIMIGPVGEKALAYLPMPGQALDSISLTAAIQESAIVYAMPYDLDEFRTLSKLARAANTQVAIDIEAAVVADRRRLEALLELADIVFFNDAGFAAATGRLPNIEAMRGLSFQGPHTVVVTRGAEGALAVNRTEAAEHPAFPVEAVVDTTGAGDCFNAAFLTAFLEQRPLADVVRFAAAAASFAVTRIGAREGFQERKVVDQLLHAHEEP